MVQRYSHLAFLRSQAAKALENSTFFIQFFLYPSTTGRNAKKEDAAGRHIDGQPRPFAFGSVFAPFSPLIDRTAPGGTNTLPPRVSLRTGGIISENSTFSIQFFACSRISGIDRQSRGKTVYTRGGISGKARYTAAVRFRQ